MARVPLNEIVFVATTPATLLPGAEVFVYERGTTDEAELFSSESGEGTLSQPLTTDSGGRIEGAGQRPWVEQGSYDLKVNGETMPWEAVNGSAFEGSRTYITLEEFDPLCGTGEHDCADAFEEAIAYPDGAAAGGDVGPNSLYIIKLKPNHVYYTSRAVELTRWVGLESTAQGGHAPATIAALPGFTDTQLVRNWQSSDWTGGESDHTIAPKETELDVFYVYLTGLKFDLRQMPKGATGLGLVHLQENCVLRGFQFLANGAKAAGRGEYTAIKLMANKERNFGPVTISDVTLYGATEDYASAFVADGSANPTNYSGQVTLRDYKTSTLKHNGDVFLFDQVQHPVLENIHCEARVNEAEAYAANAVVHFRDCSGSIRDFFCFWGSATAQKNPLVKVTNTAGSGKEIPSPIIDHLTIANNKGATTTYTWSVPFILDEAQSGNKVELTYAEEGVIYRYDGTNYHAMTLKGARINKRLNRPNVKAASEVSAKELCEALEALGLIE